jgi:Permeases of the major facilitator superfamily
LNVFCWLGIVTTIGLALVPASQWRWLLLVYIFSAIGYSASNLFYDSFLIDIADDKEMNRISTHGYAYGYLGGVIAFILFLVLQLTSGFGRLDGTGIAKWSFIIAAVWWWIFYLPLQKMFSRNIRLPLIKHQLKIALNGFSKPFNISNSTGK